MYQLAPAAIIGLVIGLAGPLATVSTCEGSSTWTHCEVSNDGSQVDVGASLTIPRDRPSAPEVSAPQQRPARPVEPAPSPTPACETMFCRPNYEVVTIPDVTIDDLASFRPARPTLTGEPQGFGVVGMPANVVAAASEQHLAGTLLGWDVVVRFTPAAYVFDYGDGSTMRTRTGGATWPQLGQAQFTPTATSHVYAERGIYTASVTVQYAAAVDFGTGWRPVAGYVSAQGDGYDVRVVDVRTALVERTCIEDPAGPGC